MPALIISSKSGRRRHMPRIPISLLGKPHARLGNPNTGIPEVIVQPLYDIYFVANDQVAPYLTLFSVAKGQTYNFGGVTGFLKTSNHTNLTQTGMLQSSYTFVVRALSMFVQGLQASGQSTPYLNAADALNLSATFAQFNINGKSYFDGLAGWLPCAGGVFGPTGGGVGSTTQAVYNNTFGLPYSKNMYQIPGGQFINPQENFDFQINPTLAAGGAWTTQTTVAPGVSAPAAGISAWVRLDGTLIRVAQ
jgi:hypothetical protein